MMTEVPNDYTQRVGEEWEPSDSILCKKIFQMMNYAYPILQQFPKAEKFALAVDMKHMMHTMLYTVTDLDSKHFKKTSLHELDTANKTLKKYVRLAFLQRFISGKQYKHWTEKLAEIGKIIGGRIQSAK